MNKYYKQELPEINTLVLIYCGSLAKPVTKVGCWSGSYWCYVTKPPSLTIFEAENVIGWDYLPQLKGQ